MLLQKFISSEAIEVLSDQDLLLLDGGSAEKGSAEKVKIERSNILADCTTTNNTNCNGGNCVAGCGAPPSTPVPSK